MLERAVVEGGEKKVGISKGVSLVFFSFLLVAENSQSKKFFCFIFWLSGKERASGFFLLAISFSN